MKKLLVLLSLLLTTPVHAGDVEEGLIGLALEGYSLTQIKEPDKQTHAFVGMVVGGWATVASKNPWIGAASAIVVGAGKETYDKNKGGPWDKADFYYTSVAGALAAFNVGKIVKAYDKKALALYTKDKNSFVLYKNNKGQPLIGWHKEL